MQLSEAAARRLAKRTGQKLPKRKVVAVFTPTDGTDDWFPRQFDFYWQLFGKVGYFADLLPEPEYPFCEGRGWRFDRAFPDYRLAIECDGECHTNVDRWHSDTEKFNIATLAGWRVLHITMRMLASNPQETIEMVRAALLMFREEEEDQ